MKLFNVDTLEEARGKLVRFSPVMMPETETVPLGDCGGRILAEDVLASENVPNFRKSTVDGYAVRAKETQGATESIPAFFDVVETVSMGRMPEKSLAPGQAAYVPTGGMLPEGADAVVMIEYAEPFDKGSIALYDAVSFGRNVMQEGEDVRQGEPTLKAGSLLRPQEVGVLASIGMTEVNVFQPWKMAVISTGDELVDVSQNPGKGQTRDINTYAIAAAGRKLGFAITMQCIIGDDRRKIKAAIAEAMESSQIVVVSGGSSQGEKDYTASVMEELADQGIVTHGIALKPGKPTILAFDERSGSLMVGLPGHPAAAMMAFELLVRWFYDRLTGRPNPVTAAVRMTENVPAAGGKTTCLLVHLEKGSDGIHAAVPLLGKSGLMTLLARADGYVLMDTNQEGFRKGELVSVTLF